MKSTPDEIEELDESDVAALLVEMEMLHSIVDALNEMMLEAEDLKCFEGDIVEPKDLSKSALGVVWNELAKYNDFMSGGEQTH
jgi:hypothetical protein